MDSETKQNGLKPMILNLAIGVAIVVMCFLSGSFILWTEPTQLEVEFFLFYASSGLALGVILIDLKNGLAQKRAKDVQMIAVGVVVSSVVVGIILSYAMSTFLWFILAFLLGVFISSTTNARDLFNPHRYDKILHMRIAKASKFPFYSSWFTAITSLVLTVSSTLDSSQTVGVSFGQFILIAVLMYYLSYPPSIAEMIEEKKRLLEALKEKYVEGKAKTDEARAFRRLDASTGEYDDSESILIEGVRFEHVADEIIHGRHYVSGLEEFCNLIEVEHKKLRSLLPSTQVNLEAPKEV